MSRETFDLLEYAHADAGKPLRIDREKGIIFGVKILGEKGNDAYPRPTREKVIPLVEGARVNVDHAPANQRGDTRSYRDAFGMVKNVAESGSGLTADYHFPAKHPLAEQLFWDAENAPHSLGFSLASRGAGDQRDTDGRRIIEHIEFDRRRHSFDLVSSPATTRGLFESRIPVKKTVRELIESLKTTRPGYSRALREMAEAGIMSPDQQCEEPGMKGPADPPPAEPADHEVALKQGFQGAMMAVLNDDGLDMKAKLKKLSEIMKAQEKLVTGGTSAGGGKGPMDGDDPNQAQESRRSKADDRLALLEAKDRVRTVADTAGIRVPTAVLNTIRPGISEAEATALVESLRPAAGTQAPFTGQKPRSAAPWQDPAAATPVQESRTDATPAPTPEQRQQKLASLRSMR